MEDVSLDLILSLVSSDCVGDYGLDTILGLGQTDCWSRSSFDLALTDCIEDF